MLYLDFLFRSGQCLDKSGAVTAANGKVAVTEALQFALLLLLQFSDSFGFYLFRLVFHGLFQLFHLIRLFFLQFFCL